MKQMLAMSNLATNTVCAYIYYLYEIIDKSMDRCHFDLHAIL